MITKLNTEDKKKADTDDLDRRLVPGIICSRKMNQYIDFNFIYDLVGTVFKDRGRPSTDR